MTDLWLIVHRQDLCDLYQLGDADADRVDDLVTRARIALGIAPTEDGTPASGIYWMVAPGEPHRSLVNRSTIGKVADLDAIPDAEVQAYRDARGF